MSKINFKQWGIRLRKIVIASLILPFFTVVYAPVAIAAPSCIENTHFSRLSADGASTVIYRFTNTSEECTYTLPAGLSTAAILVVGGGGGGGGDGGGGGGGGEVRSHSSQSFDGVTSIDILVGAGGSGRIGAWGGTGTGNGGATTVKWNSVTQYQANGGNRSITWSSTGPPGGAGGKSGVGGNANSNGQNGGFGPYQTCQPGSAPVGTPPSNSITGNSVDYGGGGGGGFGRNDSGSTPFLGAVGGGSSGGRGANYRLDFDATTQIVGATRGYNGAAFTGGGGGGGAACNAGTTDLVNQRTAGGDGAAGAVIISFSRMSQSITFDSIADRKLRAGTFSVTPTSSSSLPVTLSSSTPSVCTVSGFTITAVSVGTCTLNANQAGNANFTAATQVVRSFSFTSTNVTYTANDGSGATELQAISTTGNFNLRNNTFTRNKFRFLRWDSSSNGTGTNYSNGQSVSFIDDITLHAIWTSTISYDGNTATSSRAIETTTALGSAATTKLSDGKLLPGSVVSSGLVFNLNAADSSSVVGTTWSDTNRNGITGTLVGAPTYNATEGFFQLNGTSQYVNLGSSLLDFQGTSNYTVSAMFKSDKPAASEQSIVSRWNDNVSGIFIIRNWGSKVETYRNFYGSLPSTKNYNEGDINYVTATYNGTMLRLYLNGVLHAEVASAQSMSGQSATDVLIGATKSSNAISRYFEGKIYSVQAYSRALSLSEINQNFQALQPLQKVSKFNFTLAPWNTLANGNGTSFGTAVTDLSALPSPYMRLQPSNYNAVTKTWSNTPGSSNFTYRGTPERISSNNGRFGATGNFVAIGGTVNDGLTLGNPTLTTYTLCVVARYRGLAATPAVPASQGRIIGGTSGDWISGYHNSNISEFHHTNGYNFDSTISDLNWHYHCDSGNRAWWDGVRVSPWTNQATTSMPNIAINNWGSGQYSDWELADLIIFDQFLQDSQIEQINRYLKNTYGIVAGPSATASAVGVSPATNYASTGDTTLFANWGSAITYDGNKQTSGTAPSPTFITGASGALATNSGSLARAGFKFDGWNTNESGTGTTYVAGGTYPNTGNITLYAKWSLPIVFPTSASTIDPNNLLPYMRYKASDYDATNKIWRDSSGNGRSTALINGSPTVVTTTGNGSNKNITVLQGVTTDSIRFENPTTTGGRYTLFSLIRYNTSTAAKQGRILNSLDNTWFTGHWNQRAGVSYHEDVWLRSTSTVAPVTNWVLGTDYASNYRSNGQQIAVANAGGANLRRLTINGAAEPSDFQVAEIILYDRALTLTEIRQVEEYLAYTYGISAYVLTGTYGNSTTLAIGAGVGGRSETLTAINGHENKTITMSPARNGISLETTTANSVVLVVSPTAASGTYAQTITATDGRGETSTYFINVIVSPSVKFDTSTATTLLTTYRKTATLQLNTVFGVGMKIFTMTPVTTGLTIDTSTAAASGFATLRVDTFTAPGTYVQAITVTDDTRIRSTFTITIIINAPPTISSNSAIVTSPVLDSLRLNLDAGDLSSYSGSGNTWTDLSGNGRNATLVSSPTFSTSNGGILNLNGTSQYATVPSVRSEVFTVEAWVRFNALNNNYACVVTNTYPGSNNSINYAICFWNNGTIRAGYHPNIWSTTFTGAFTPLVNTWYQLVYRVEKVGSNYIGSLFQNGNLVPGQSNSTTAPVNSGAGDRIGRAWDSSAYINGSIPVVRIYSRALSTAEIIQNYNALLPRFSNNPSNQITITTTESVTASSSIYYAGLGTGNKTFSLSNPTTGISIDTSTVNTVRLNTTTTLAASSTTVARSISQVITATDVNGVSAATPVYVTTVVNPKIIVTDQTPGTLTTTFGRIAYDTFTATQGTETKTFTVSSASFGSAFVMTNPSANTGLLTVGSNLPVGTYPVTITATDRVGATTNYLLTVVINPAPTITSSVGTIIATTISRAASVQLAVSGGTGALTAQLAFTSLSSHSGITLNSSNLINGALVLNIAETVTANSYPISVTARDINGSSGLLELTIVVNQWPVIPNRTSVNQNVMLLLDGSASGSLSSSSWIDQSGNNRNATTASGSPIVSSEAGGALSLNETSTLTTAAMKATSNIGQMKTFSIETWAKVYALPSSGNLTCIVCEKYANGHLNYAIYLTSTGISVGYVSSTVWSITYSTSRTDYTLPTSGIGTWNHLVYTVSVSGSTYTSSLYVNGILRSSYTSAVEPRTSGSDILIGDRWEGATKYRGAVGLIRIYNRTLSNIEISGNYFATASRFAPTNSGTSIMATTQGTSRVGTTFLATGGTGSKTFARTTSLGGISLSANSPNTFSLDLSDTLTATDTQTARTLFETITATDSAGAVTTLAYTITINPPIRVESTTGTITTTSGIVAWDTFTATQGTGSKTFTLISSSSTPGFSLTQGINQAVLRVGSTVNPGTYTLTITATDSVGAITSITKTVIVNALPTITGNVSFAGTTGFAFASPNYTSANGTGTRTFSISVTPATAGRNVSGITLSATTGSPTINVSSGTLADTYTITLRVTDSLTAFTTMTVTLRVNPQITLTGSLTLSKVYGEELSQVYTTGGGTAPFSIFSSSLCTTEKSTYVGNGTNGLLGVSYTVERFNGVGTCNWVVPTGVTTGSVLVVGGGGAGGGGIGGGGGAGEFHEVSSLALSQNSTTSVVVAAGGVANAWTTGSAGGNSSFGPIVGYGGGGGGTNESNGPSPSQGFGGNLYGSGGGGGYPNTSWSGTTRLYGVQDNTSRGSSSAYRRNGGFGSGGGSDNATGGGGGGAGADGGAGTTSTGSPAQSGGNGGVGLSSSITGTSTFYAGGGGGGVNGAFGFPAARSTGLPGSGGNGGGGAGGLGGGRGTVNNVDNPQNGNPGAANSGGGGGGGSNTQFGGRGGSGTVIIRYVTPEVDSESARITLDTLSTTPTGSLRLNAPKNLAVGTYTQTITVTDATGSTGSTPVTVTLTVAKATPTLALALPGAVTTAKYGSPVSISATSPIPGRVAFVNGSETITACSSVLASSGLATCSWTPTVVGATTLRAILTPTDTANYNSSALVSLAITVAKADTLTVTVISQTETFTGSAIVATRAFTTTGLASIDSLTAISMLFAGSANDGTSYSSTTAPTNAGSYTITPNYPANAAAFTFATGSAGTISAITNYESVTVVAGTLTINRAPQVMSFTFANSNTVTYSPTATLASTATARLGTGTRTYSSTTPITCSISETAVVTVLQAGSCSVAMAVALTANYQADTATAAITINKASRTFTLVPAVATLKYADTTTVTATLSGGASDGAISYTLGSPAGCTFDPLTGELTAISGTIQCPLTATISEGINYLAETSTAISLTIARANAPVITIDTVTALSHTPGIRGLVTPNYTVAGLKNLDTFGSLTLTYSFVSNPFAPFSYSDTRTPIDAGTYRITPSALTLSVGLISNYETPTYSASAIDFTINRINQETVTVENTNSEVDVPFALYGSGGSTSEAFTFTLVSGTSCSISGNQLNATAAGTCVVTVTRGGDRNYLPRTSAEVTVRVRNFVLVVTEAPSNPVTGITIVPSTPPLTKAPDSNACTTGCVPKINSIDVLEAAEGDLVVITGLSFNGVTKVYFRLDTFSPTDDVEAPNFAVDSDTQISVRVPAGLVAGEFYTIRVATPDKTSARFYDIEILP